MDISRRNHSRIEVDTKLDSGKCQACPWEWDSQGNPMGNVSWDGMGWDSTNCISHGTVAKHFHSKVF